MSQRPSTPAQATLSDRAQVAPLQEVEQSDPDLNRPAQLIQLRNSIKAAYTSSTAESRNQIPSALAELQQARQRVRIALARLGLQNAAAEGHQKVTSPAENIVERGVRHDHENDITDPMDDMDDEEVAAWS